MEIHGIIGRNRNEFRLQVRANESMNKGWLNFINKEYHEENPYVSFTQAMNDPKQYYLSNNDGYLVMEVIRTLDKDDYYVEYYFDKNEIIDADLTDEEVDEIDAFIKTYIELLPDQSDHGCSILTGRDYVKHLPIDVPWRSNFMIEAA